MWVLCANICTSWWRWAILWNVITTKLHTYEKRIMPPKHLPCTKAQKIWTHLQERWSNSLTSSSLSRYISRENEKTRSFICKTKSNTFVKHLTFHNQIIKNLRKISRKWHAKLDLKMSSNKTKSGCFSRKTYSPLQNSYFKLNYRTSFTFKVRLLRNRLWCGKRSTVDTFQAVCGMINRTLRRIRKGKKQNFTHNGTAHTFTQQWNLK
jgi:hypothetical protein